MKLEVSLTREACLQVGQTVLSDSSVEGELDGSEGVSHVLDRFREDPSM